MTSPEAQQQEGDGARGCDEGFWNELPIIPLVWLTGFVLPRENAQRVAIPVELTFISSHVIYCIGDPWLILKILISIRCLANQIIDGLK